MEIIRKLIEVQQQAKRDAVYNDQNNPEVRAMYERLREKISNRTQKMGSANPYKYEFQGSTENLYGFLTKDGIGYEIKFVHVGTEDK